MCGIVGAISQRPVRPILLEGLRRLEYRGYDSSGLVTIQNGSFQWDKRPGKIRVLEDHLKGKNWNGHIGLGHTRWATHGPPTRDNAHPHFSCDEKIALVHNGIIENYESLKENLIRRGHQFRSETDTEIIAHLIEEHAKKNKPFVAVQKAIKELEGSFALGVMFRDHPDLLIGARLNSPLVVGIGRNENFIASDVPALLPFTKKVIYLNENEMVQLQRDRVTVSDLNGRVKRRPPTTITWDITSAEKEGYPHFMLKEIFEQPRAVKTTTGYYVNRKKSCTEFAALKPVLKKLNKINRVIITACGTAWHAGLVGKYALEELTRLPVDVAIASEFRYGNPVLNKNTLVLAISQSGETADTLAAVRQANEHGALTLAICNVVGSSITREAKATIYTYAGPEISVASTKAYTSQLTLILLLAIYLGRARKTITKQSETKMIREFLTLPKKIEAVLKTDQLIDKCAAQYRDAPNFMYIGRRYNFPNAYEGALKLKEISYTHAEGYGAGEMKHGPLALVDNTFPTVAIAVQSSVHEKMVSNIQEIKARSGIIIAITTEGDKAIDHLADCIITVPETSEMFSPILTVIPLQLLAYHMAVKKGCPIDQPRNLAKSVTVE